MNAVTIARIEDEGVLELRAGHGRVEGLSAILKEDPEFVPAGAPGAGLVRALIYSFPTRAAADAYGLADNRLAEIADPDEDAVAAILRELDADGFSLDGLGWQDGELEALLKVAETEPPADPAPTASSRNIHPTVKPVRLMTWIVRLITPPGGRLFAPFIGSGTDLLAGEAVGVVVEGCELEPAYCDIARARFLGRAGGA